MQTHRARLIVALILVALLAAVIAGFVSSARASERHIADQRSEIERRLQAGTSRIEFHPPTKDLVRELLKSDEGREQLAALDARREDFAFDPVRRNVYWVAPEVTAGAEPKHGVNSVGEVMSGHSGFPSHIQLRAIRCEGAQLLIDLETLQDYRKPKLLGGVWPPEPGRRYEAVAELATLKQGYFQMESVSEYRPLER